MNQKTFDDLLQKSRNQASATLFGGDLQLNTDTYLKPTDLNSQDKIPPPPPAIFSENGATNELDNRRFMLLQPQVPRNPELEALNSYFNQQRVESFAKASLNQIVRETIQKQAETNAENLMRDEMDRRTGIRRQVLDMTGLTPAQIDQQIVAESFAGINPRTMDMRERQVQDAVARFYSIQNIPAPAIAQTIDAIPATIPREVSGMEREEGMTAMRDEDVMTALFTADGEMMQPTPEIPDAPPRRVAQRKYDPDIRELPQSLDAVALLPKFALTSLIINNRIATPLTARRDGGMKSAETLDGIPIAELRMVVEEAVMEKFGMGGGGGGGGVRNPAL
jgi:hypothetical protein